MNALLLCLALVAQEPSGVKSAAEERFHLWGAYSLGDPWFLLAIPVGLACLWWGRSRAGRAHARVSVLPGASLGRSWPQRLGWLVPLAQALALCSLAIALARPLRGSTETSSVSEGVDIALVIDRSGSMHYEDLEPGKSRLEVVKEVVRDFAVRRMTDREGAADNVALITFAAFPQLLCPFTLDVDAVTGFLAGLQPVAPNNRAEDGTAIGIGLSKAVAVLKETDARSKVVVLLTDGENNIDYITPADAAKLAADEHVKVYTVFAGRFVYTMDFFNRPQATEREIDTSDLENIARVTGGTFFRARDKAELAKVYAEIEALERTKREQRHWSETFDLYPWFLVPALALYAAAWLAATTLLRRIA
jgi:Ca-activated chloride channel homolog